MARIRIDDLKAARPLGRDEMRSVRGGEGPKRNRPEGAPPPLVEPRLDVSDLLGRTPL